MPTPIVMIHGAFCADWVFDDFRAPFESAGHLVITPDLPGHEAAARPGAVAGLSMRDYARSVSDLCAAQDAPPILIGHSLGGLAAQLAAAITPVEALILLAPSAPWGVPGGTMEEGISALSLYALGPFWLQAVDPDYPAARHYLFDPLPREERRDAFARMRPESGLALWETLNWWLDPTAATLLVSEPRRSRPRCWPWWGRKMSSTRRRPSAPPRSAWVARRAFCPAWGIGCTGEPEWPDVSRACLPGLDRGRSGAQRRLSRSRAKPNAATRAQDASIRKAERLKSRLRENITRHAPARFIASDVDLSGSSRWACAAA